MWTMVGWKLPGLCALGDLDLSGCAFGGWELHGCGLRAWEVGNCMIVDEDVTRSVAAWLWMRM